MEKIKVISDGSCDLNEEQVIENELHIVPFYVSFDGTTYQKEKEELNVRDFYQRMIDNPKVFPKTSLPAIQDYVDVFNRYLSEGYAVICICITSKFSGSYNAACVAREMVVAEDATARITVIDSQVNTCLQGLVVLEVADMVKKNLSYEEIIEKTETIKSTGRIYFTVDGLDYLAHGGRIGKLTSLIGNTLRIKPLIVLKEGEIFSKGFTLSRKRAKQKIFQNIVDHLKKIGARICDYRFVIGYGYDIEEGLGFRQEFEKVMGAVGTLIAQIGAAIAVHTGPYPLGVGLIKKWSSQ